MSMLRLDEPSRLGDIFPVNWISVGDEAAQATSILPMEYWNAPPQTGFLGVFLSENEHDGLDWENDFAASLYIDGSFRSGLGDYISAQKAFNPYKDSVQSVLSGAKLNTVFSCLGRAFPSGITPSMARASKEEGAVTIGVMSIPHRDEGRKHFLQSRYAVDETRSNVDALCLMPLDVIYQHLSSTGILENLGNSVNLLFTRVMRGIVDLASRPGFRSPDIEEIVSFFRGAGDVLIGYSEIAREPGGTFNAIRRAMEHPIDSMRRFEGAEQILVSICPGEAGIEPDAYFKIGHFCREFLGHDTDVIIGNFKSNISGENPWIAIYGRHIHERRQDGFDFPVSDPPPEKAPPGLPAYYRTFFSRSQKAMNHEF